jgi:hypothetical protein
LREGLALANQAQSDDSCNLILNIMEELYYIQDLNVLLDTVLYQARRLTHADAGSIYLIEGNVLHFSYIHNDTLFDVSTASRYIYTGQTLPIDSSSLTGYVALTGQTLVIDDAYEIPPDMPFTFNVSFDRKSGYRTRSILATPLKTSRGKVVGVLAIINAKSPTGESIPFTHTDQVLLNYFANNAASAIERALINRNVILRMIKVCELRDPKETGPHANRVGAYSAEIYQEWAAKQGLAREEIKRYKDHIRVAAMLHDLGKVAISDNILKKPGALDQDEFQVMKWHTVFGARLFGDTNSDLDVISAEIALNHHEKWDGSGYPGEVANIFAPQPQMGSAPLMVDNKLSAWYPIHQIGGERDGQARQETQI